MTLPAHWKPTYSIITGDQLFGCPNGHSWGDPTGLRRIALCAPEQGLPTHNRDGTPINLNCPYDGIAWNQAELAFNGYWHPEMRRQPKDWPSSTPTTGDRPVT